MWYQRLLPYPLLAPWTEDYEDAAFGVDVPEAVLNNGREIRISLVFRLSSNSLRELVSNEKARYAVEVSCPRTLVSSTRETLVHDELVLEAGDYAEELLLTPYLVSVCSLEEFRSLEHAGEWRDHRPEGFSVPSAGILAVGNTTRVVLEDSGVNSVIDLIANPSVGAGTFHIQVDDERIKIHVPIAEKEKIEAVRRRRGSGVEFAGLFPGLYLHAVAEALRSLSDYENTRWAFTMRNALEKCGHGGVDVETLGNDALKYAQDLMEQPVGAFLAAALSDDEERLDV